MSHPEDEYHRLADDGCPNVDPPTVQEEVVQEMFGLWVPYQPATTRAMIGHLYHVNIDPLEESGTSGSRISSACENDILALFARFYPTGLTRAYGYDTSEDEGTAS